MDKLLMLVLFSGIMACDGTRDLYSTAPPTINARLAAQQDYRNSAQYQYDQEAQRNLQKMLDDVRDSFHLKGQPLDLCGTYDGDLDLHCKNHIHNLKIRQNSF